MDLQSRYLDELKKGLEADPTIKAAWASGSLGRGDADRYSDVDLNLWLDPADVDEFRNKTEAWLNRIRPLVLFRWLFDNRMANCLTVDGLRLDLWLFSEPELRLDSARVLMLVQREKVLAPAAFPSNPKTNDLAEQLLQQIREFWRCIALLPSVIGRDERIMALSGLTVEVNILTDFLIKGYGIPRDSGVKRLNRFLPEGLQSKIEEALALDGLTNYSLARCHLALACIMRMEGRQIATRTGFEYPVEIERAALDYTIRELAMLGITDLGMERERL